MPRAARRRGLRARPRARSTSSRRGSRGTRSRVEGVDLVMRLTGGRGRRSRARAASCASRPGGDFADPRGRRWSARGRAGGARRRACATAILRSACYPDALARVWAALSCSTTRRRPAVRASGLGVPGLGRARPRRRGHARLAAPRPTPRASCCGAGPARPGARSARQWRSGRRADGARPLRRRPERALATLPRLMTRRRNDRARAESPVGHRAPRAAPGSGRATLRRASTWACASGATGSS